MQQGPFSEGRTALLAFPAIGIALRTIGLDPGVLPFLGLGPAGVDGPGEVPVVGIRFNAVRGRWPGERSGAAPELVVRTECPELGEGRLSIELDPASLELSVKLPWPQPWPALLLAVDGAISAALAFGGVAVVHAAAFTWKGRPVLAVGAGGSGKSTLAAIALTHGESVAGDDTVGVVGEPAGAVAAAFRPEASLRARTVEMLGLQHLERVDTPRGPRWILPLSRDGAPRRVPLAGGLILLLEGPPSAGRTALVPARSSTALALLMAASSPALLGPGTATFASRLGGVLAGISEALPAFRVRLGRDLLDRPVDTLERLVAAGGE